MKKGKILALSAFMLIALAGCGEPFENPGDYLGGGGVVDDVPDTPDNSGITDDIGTIDVEDSGTDTEDSYEDLASYVKISLAQNNTTIEGEGAVVENNIVSITAAGTYYFTGSLTDGRIYVNFDGNVRLIFNGITIDSKDGAPVVIMGKKKKVITLVPGTVSTFSDAVTYSTFYNTDNDEPNAAIFSKKALTINGKGSMVVNGFNNNGIGCKDELRVLDAKINVSAPNNGVKGNDNIIIKNADVSVISEQDGMKSDSEDEGLGNVYITGSKINIDSNEDGIQAYRYLVLEDNEMSIITNGGADNNTEVKADDDPRPGGPGGGQGGSSTTTTTDDTSRKGIKSDFSIQIKSGTYTLDNYDDSIHSNDAILINAGTFNIKSGDDAIHADGNVEINGGTFNINKSYEGIEGTYIVINDGTINIVSSDDGINAATDGTERPSLIINNGTITIDASGDGIDSNGTVLITGGTITIHGPTSGADAALDSDYGILTNGGTLYAAGSLGMVETPASNSTQYVLNIALSSKLSANGEVSIKNSNGEVLLTYKGKKQFQSLIISSPLLQKNTTYQLYINGSKSSDFTISSTITKIGSSSGRP